MLPFYSPYIFYSNYVGQTGFQQIPMIPFTEQPIMNTNPSIVKQQESPLNYVDLNFQQQSNQNSFSINLNASQLKKESYVVNKRLWTEDEDKLLFHFVDEQKRSWKQASKLMLNRSPKMCYNRYKRIKRSKKHLWTRSQDEKLKFLVQQRKLKWKHIENHFQNRKAKQIRQRYLNFLRSNISRGPWTLQQDMKLIQSINKIGKKWKQIEKVLTNRSENQIKNRYYGKIKHILKNKQTQKIEKEQNSMRFCNKNED